MSHRWKVQLALQAEQDFAEILQWTARTFGPAQAEIYAETLGLAIEALSEGPDVTGIRPGTRFPRVFERRTSLARGAKVDTSLCFARGQGR